MSGKINLKLALLGGSFDPPHEGHVQCIQYLLDSGKYDQVWVVPTAQNPFKPIQTSFNQRLEMCRLAFQNIEDKEPVHHEGGLVRRSGTRRRVKILDDEKQLSGYSIDLVRHLLDQHPEVQITWVGGSDLKAEVTRWKDWEILKTLIRFEFFPRPPDPASPFPAISSTELRQEVRQNGPWQSKVPRAVAEFIVKHGLYR